MVGRLGSGLVWWVVGSAGRFVPGCCRNQLGEQSDRSLGVPALSSNGRRLVPGGARALPGALPAPRPPLGASARRPPKPSQAADPRVHRHLAAPPSPSAHMTRPGALLQNRGSRHCVFGPDLGIPLSLRPDCMGNATVRE